MIKVGSSVTSKFLNIWSRFFRKSSFIITIRPSITGEGFSSSEDYFLIAILGFWIIIIGFFATEVRFFTTGISIIVAGFFTYQANFLNPGIKFLYYWNRAFSN